MGDSAGPGALTGASMEEQQATAPHGESPAECQPAALQPRCPLQFPLQLLWELEGLRTEGLWGTTGPHWGPKPHSPHRWKYHLSWSEFFF